MAGKNETLTEARRTKNDEFYTQLSDIQAEMNAYLDFNTEVFKDKTVLLPCDDPEWSNFTRFFAQNFTALGLKKLISTSYASESKQKNCGRQMYFDFLTEFETSAPQYDKALSPSRGKIFTLTRKSKRVDLNDLKWKYMKGDGDFRSGEVCKLRDEADIIVTNPPFSLFREFLDWIVGAGKNFSIIGNVNALTYKEVFPLIKGNKIWLGCRGLNKDMYFLVPEKMKGWLVENKKEGSAYKIVNDIVMGRLANACWFTNIDHGRRHQPMTLMSMEDNRKFSKHKEIMEKGYLTYDNYDAIEVPYTDAIPSDYDGAMGVPITFMDKFCPDQFKLLGATESEGVGFSNGLWDSSSNVAQPMVNGQRLYKRVFIQRVNS